MTLQPLFWDEGALMLLDQRELPLREVWLRLTTWQQVRDAITDMAVRGAPAIGVAAAYGMALAAQTSDDLQLAHHELRNSRPTAVNLMWALDRVAASGLTSFELLLGLAESIRLEDLALNHKIGEHGAMLVPENARILTICNTGSLATAGHGTALGVIRTAHEQGKINLVYSCETRPRLQGLKLTAWELMHDKIPFQSIVDGAVGYLMQTVQIDFVIAGADRIARNGDTANKIGTYGLAVLARHHRIPFYIAAPYSTFDLTLANGKEIPIEERDSDEIRMIGAERVAPENCPVWNPGFDVTPGTLIDGIITESGILKPPYSLNEIYAPTTH